MCFVRKSARMSLHLEILYDAFSDLRNINLHLITYKFRYAIKRISVPVDSEKNPFPSTDIYCTFLQKFLFTGSSNHTTACQKIFLSYFCRQLETFLACFSKQLGPLKFIKYSNCKENQESLFKNNCLFINIKIILQIMFGHRLKELGCWTKNYNKKC